MSANVAEQLFQQLEVVKEEHVAAPIDIVFETLLEQLGPLNETPDGTPMPLKLEAWPGGRWFRDLGNNMGHFWGVVQSIKAPTLLEIQGPMFMSAPVMSHVLYRLTAEVTGTRIAFSHRIAGQIDPNWTKVNEGWTYFLSRVQQQAEAKGK